MSRERQVQLAALALWLTLGVGCAAQEDTHVPVQPMRLGAARPEANANTSTPSGAQNGGQNTAPDSSKIQDPPVGNGGTPSDETEAKDEPPKESEAQAKRREDLERAQKSTCRYFTSTSELSFTFAPKKKDNLMVIDHLPPATYPMPVHKTFATSGYFEGNAYKLIAMVDVKLSFAARDPYETKWRRALPGDPEHPKYERQYWNVTIMNADHSTCMATASSVDGDSAQQCAIPVLCKN